MVGSAITPLEIGQMNCAGTSAPSLMAMSCVSAIAIKKNLSVTKTTAKYQTASQRTAVKNSYAYL